MKDPHTTPTFQSARKDARLLLKDFRSDDPERRASALERIATHPSLQDSEAIADRPWLVTLAQAQQVVAMERGFRDWKALRDALLMPMDADASALYDHVLGLRGAHVDGYTPEDIDAHLPLLSEWLGGGARLAVLWDYADSWGPDGNSDMYVLKDGSWRDIPDGLWDFLSDPDGTISPLAFRNAACDAPKHPGAEPHEVSPHNYALRRAGTNDDLAPDLVVLTHAGVTVWHAYKQSSPALLSEHWYRVADGEFDVRDLATAFEGDHATAIRLAIQTGELTSRGIDPAAHELAAQLLEHATLVASQAVLEPASLYLAVIDMGESWHLEPELDEGTIGPVYDTLTEELDRALDLAAVLEHYLKREGVNVFRDYDAWQAHLEGEEE
jgi:hypothetical protein